MAARIGIGIALVAAVVWFLFGRGDDADAVTSCMRKAGATVEQSPRFAQLFPYAMALGGTDGVQSYPELSGGKMYSVRSGSGALLLFVGRDEDAARTFESTLVSFAASGGVTLPSRRSGKVLLVRASGTTEPELDACVR